MKNKLYMVIILLIAIFVTIQLQISSLESEIIEDRFQVKTLNTPVLRIANKSKRIANMILVPGYACNSGQLTWMAKLFAIGGINTYTIDLPGHASSSEKFIKFKDDDQIRLAISSLMLREELLPSETILLGWSYGGHLVLPLDMGEKNFIATVLLGPGLKALPTTDNPKNLFILRAEQTFKSIERAVAKLINAATGMSSAQAGKPYFVGGGEKKLEIIPNETHVSMIYAQETYKSVATWLANYSSLSTLSKNLDIVPRYLKLALIRVLLSIAISLFLIIALVKFFTDKLSSIRDVSCISIDAKIYDFSCLAIVLPFCAYLDRFIPRTSIFSIKFLQSFLFCFFGAAILSAIYFSLRKLFKVNALVKLLPSILAGVALFLLIYISTQVARIDQFFNLTLYSSRLFVFIYTTLLLMPFFIFVESIFARESNRSGIVNHFVDIGLRGSVLIVLGLSFSLLQIRNSYFIHGFIVFLAIIAIPNFFVNRKLKNPIISGCLSSLVVAWYICAGFVSHSG